MTWFTSELAGRLSGLVFLSAFVPYFYTSLIGKTRPNRASWWIWAVLGFLILASYKLAGATDTIWMAVAGAIGPCAIAIVSIWRGEGGATKRDLSCIVLTAIGLLLWGQTSDAFIGLLLFLFADLMAAIPTVVKAWYEPEGEDPLSWLLWSIGSSLNVYALSSWDIQVSLYPVYFSVGATMIFLFTLRRFLKPEVV